MFQSVVHLSDGTLALIRGTQRAANEDANSSSAIESFCLTLYTKAGERLKAILELIGWMLRGWDGRAALLLCLMSICWAFVDIATIGPQIQGVRFVFYSMIFVLIFLRFRLSQFDGRERVNWWGLFNIVLFAIFIFWLEICR